MAGLRKAVDERLYVSRKNGGGMLRRGVWVDGQQRVVIFGAGTAGIGAADQICGAMVREGLSKEDAARRFWCVDRQGLLTTSMADPLRDYQLSYARPAAES